LWYIFPARTLAGLGAVVLTPHSKGHKYERYMENWWLLTRHHFRRGTRTVVLTPHSKGHKYERYMENWWLLTRHHFRRGTRTVVPPEVGRPGSVDRLSARIVERIRGMAKGG
jgi:hypothetical protein